MKIKSLLFIVLFILFAPTVVFAETTIKAEVDKTSITTDDNITYKLIITLDEKKIPEPQVPKFQDFYVLSQAQSSTVSFVKNKTKTILVYAYILAAKDVGKFKIEPSLIKIQGKTYSTEAFQIEVAQGKVKLQPKSEQGPSLPEKPQPETKQPQITL